MQQLAPAIVHLMLVLSFLGNLSTGFAFPTRFGVSRSMHGLQELGFVPPTPTMRRKPQNGLCPGRKFCLSSFISESGMGEDLLSYLPNRGQDMPPDFLKLVRDATTRYSHPSSFRQDEGLNGIAHIIDVIDFEYKVSSKRPVRVQNVTYSNLPNVTKLLSICLSPATGPNSVGAPEGMQ